MAWLISLACPGPPTPRFFELHDLADLPVARLARSRGVRQWRLRASARTVTFLMCESQGNQEEYDRVITDRMVIVTAQLSSLLATKCGELLPRRGGG